MIFFKKILFVLILFNSLIIYSQPYSSSSWSLYRHELVFGSGISSYSGDLGNSIEVGLAMPLIHIGFRSKLVERIAVKFNGNFTYLIGDDAKFNNLRNLSFRSSLIEISAQLEFSLIKDKLKKMSAFEARQSFINNFNLYLFVGIGGFRFNPQAKIENEKGNTTWLDLQPLGTEGQGIGRNPDKYDLIEFCFPFGIGVKTSLTQTIAFEIDFGFRYTTTDYLDDVSDMYFDNGKIERSYGKIAANLADRHIDENGELSDEKYLSMTKRGGYENNDNYFFINISAVYRIKTANRAGRAKKRRRF